MQLQWVGGGDRVWLRRPWHWNPFCGKKVAKASTKSMWRYRRDIALYYGGATWVHERLRAPEWFVARSQLVPIRVRLSVWGTAWEGKV